MASKASSATTYNKVMESINVNFDSPYRNRMLAQLLENQTLDAWMTWNLMHETLQWVETRSKELFGMEFTIDEKIMTRDQGSCTSAEM